MKKLFAIIKREYITRVKTKMFIIGTILMPLMIVFWLVVPALLFSIKAGDATRLAVVDQSGKIFESMSAHLLDAEKEEDPDEEQKKDLEQTSVVSINQDRAEEMKRAAKSITGTFVIERVDLKGRSINEVRGELEERVKNKELDAYVIVPTELGEESKAEFVSRNVSDFATLEQIRDALNNAVRDQRMTEARIDKEKINSINRPLDWDTREAGGQTELSGGEATLRWALPFGVGLLIYVLLLVYGQSIMAAVIEEKETRIAEILFSSVNSFHLMLGKLIGVSLVAMTQLAVWALAASIFIGYGLVQLVASGVQIPNINVTFGQLVSLFIFFVLGYFLYAAIYALVGSMVTTAQEGGQLAMPLIIFLVIGFYLAFPVIRSPESNFAFWLSIVPLWSPILMSVRIMTQTPPVWQILLSMFTTAGMGVLLVWVASRVYRVGMLMYGKRATIPEALKWIRQQ